jgi:hypothetical protein
VPIVSRLCVERVVHVPFSLAHDFAEEFFRDAERYVDLRVPLRDLFWALRGKLRRPVRLTFALRPDDAEEGRLHDAMLIEWNAGTRLFPQFHGTLRLRIASIDDTLLTLEGEYRPPFGAVGLLFDRLAGQGIAHSTMSDLLRRLAVRMEHRTGEARAEIERGTSGISA